MDTNNSNKAEIMLIEENYICFSRDGIYSIPLCLDEVNNIEKKTILRNNILEFSILFNMINCSLADWYEIFYLNEEKRNEDFDIIQNKLINLKGNHNGI